MAYGWSLEDSSFNAWSLDIREPSTPVEFFDAVGELPIYGSREEARRASRVLFESAGIKTVPKKVQIRYTDW